MTRRDADRTGQQHQSADHFASDSEDNRADTDVESLCEGEASSSQQIDVTVESRAHGWRLDHYLSRLFGNHSRSQLQRAIESGCVQLNGLKAKPSRRLRVNDRILVNLPDADESHFKPEDIPLQILYEDESLVAVNKPAGMVVHPGRGSYSGTLAAALQFHFDQLSDVAGRHRPGIVHRLDRDTTGVILIAKDNQVHQKISGQFERREVKKEYRAIVRGLPELQSDFIRTHVCVHPRVREKMTVCPPGSRSREAVTFYSVLESFGAYSLVELHPHTGRTHQLRVHMQHIGTPIISDRAYSGEAEFTRQHLFDDKSQSATDEEVLIARQALHAFRIAFQHPVSGQTLQLEAPLPEDFQRTLTAMRESQSL